MADKLHFSLVSPARELFSGQVDHVIAPGTEGEFGVLAHHAPFMTTLKNGIVRVLEGDAVKMRIYVRGGFADVTPAGLTILAEEARNLTDAKAEDVDAESSERPDSRATSSCSRWTPAMQSISRCRNRSLILKASAPRWPTDRVQAAAAGGPPLTRYFCTGPVSGEHGYCLPADHDRLAGCIPHRHRLA